MKIFNLIVLGMTTVVLPVVTHAEDVTVRMHAVDESGISDSIGVVVISRAAHGVEFKPDLSGLTPGEHGFHVHENFSCEPAMDDEGEPGAALSAGGHYDPKTTDQHGSPLSEDGHLGDLPVLVADTTGRANTPVHAVQLGMEDLADRTLMVHVGGDNYSDTPEPLGGGGARFACGLINP